MNRSVGLLCLIIFVHTLSIGAFPVLLPEIGKAAGVDYLALGTVAGAFGLARVFADVPAGLFITHYLRRALVIGSIVYAIGTPSRAGVHLLTSLSSGVFMEKL